MNEAILAKIGGYSAAPTRVTGPGYTISQTRYLRHLPLLSINIFHTYYYHRYNHHNRRRRHRQSSPAASATFN